MSQARTLSSEDIRGLRAELAAGNTPTVWFTSSAVGVKEGRSGKVTALDDAAEGDFIQVRPAGSKDVLSFSAGEVTVVKPARPRKDTAATSGKAAATSGKKTADTSGSVGAAKSTGAVTSSSKPVTTAAAEPPEQRATAESVVETPAKASDSKADGSKSGNPKSGNPKTDGSSAKAAGPAATAEEPRSGTAARRKPRQPSGAIVTLTAGPEGQWSVEVSNGKKRVLRPTSVPASAVAHAAKALHDDVAQAVEPLLEAAREHQRTRVEQLQQELSDAQRMLDDLTE